MKILNGSKNPGASNVLKERRLCFPRFVSRSIFSIVVAVGLVVVCLSSFLPSPLQNQGEQGTGVALHIEQIAPCFHFCNGTPPRPLTPRPSPSSVLARPLRCRCPYCLPSFFSVRETVDANSELQGAGERGRLQENYVVSLFTPMRATRKQEVANIKTRIVRRCF